MPKLHICIKGGLGFFSRKQNIKGGYYEQIIFTGFKAEN